MLEIYYNASFHIVATVLCVALLCFQLLEQRTKKRQNHIFIALLIDLLITTVASVFLMALVPYARTSSIARWGYDFSQYLYFVAHTLLSPMFCLYVLEATGSFYVQSFFVRMILTMPCAVAELFVLTNPVTHAVYYTDLNMTFSRHWAEYFVYGVAAFYFAMAAGYLLFSWHVMTFRRRWALIYSFALALAGILLQLFFPSFRVELVLEAVAFLGIQLHVEREEDRLDSVTNVYNRNALVSDTYNYVKMGRSFVALCVRLLDSDYLQRLTGSADSDMLLSNVSKELSRMHPAHHIYRVSPYAFILIGTETTEQRMMNVANLVARRFENLWNLRETSVQLEAVILMASVPEEISGDDLMLLSDAPLPPGCGGKIAAGQELTFLNRNTEIEEALSRGLAEYSFETQYIPIYDWKKRSIFAAEAILQLHDAALGTLKQEEFYPVAIENGTWDNLIDLLFRDVALFLGSGVPIEMGLERIAFSVPASQCIQPGFLDDTRQRVERYNLDPARIVLEVQDISLVQDRKRLSDTLRALSDIGFRITLDQYGVGNSGIHSLGFFPYDVVSIDLNTISEEAELYMRRSILLASIHMLNALHHRILIKGISVDPQLQIIEETDVNYIQGPLLSTAVSQMEFMTILRATDMSRQEEEKARAQNEAKSSFLANMSHEIRTPINAILGMNEMILREATDDTIRAYARDIERAGTNLLSIINDILDFSKIEAGSMEIVEAEYELSSVLHDVMNMIRIKTEEKGLSLKLDLDPNLPECLYGDEMRLRQILINVLNNAVKYTDKGGIKLRVRGGFAEGDSVLLTCDVIDTGMGIKEEDQAKLFDKFQRLDIAQNRTVEGTGLGLSITANLLAMMGGTIEVQSIYGTGSTFTIKLQQRVIRWAPIGDLEKRYRDTEKNRKRNQGAFTAPEVTILVVDDTNMNLTVVKALLKRTLIKIDTASSGAQALQMIREKHYDLIFLDYRMPEMDGSETLQRIKEDRFHPNQETPVIVLTANALSGARERFLEEGFEDYLSKPIDSAKMEAVLIQYLPAEKVKLSQSDSGKGAKA
ncbi:MAG: EAL domain-containing protein [Lachnospiraceae bacterium]|nr:EAL domain-containing protein [Lachnospiraceae bacterium]